MGMAEVTLPVRKLWAELACGRETRVPATTRLGDTIECRGHWRGGNDPAACRVVLLSDACRQQRRGW